MIVFKSIGADNQIMEWKFNSTEELKRKWSSPECLVPANDDPIWDVEIDGNKRLREATFEAIGTDSVWFEDLLTYLGIEIWW